jgi:hypothetical protein
MMQTDIPHTGCEPSTSLILQPNTSKREAQLGFSASRAQLHYTFTMPTATTTNTMTPTTPFSPSSHTNSVEAFSFPNTYIQRSRPYLTAAQIESLRPSESRDEARAISTRLTACQWIVQVSAVLQLYPLEISPTFESV